MIKVYSKDQTETLDQLFARSSSERIMTMSWDTDSDKLKAAREVWMSFNNEARLSEKINGCRVLLIKSGRHSNTVLARANTGYWVDITHADADELRFLPATAPATTGDVYDALGGMLGDMLRTVLRN